MQLLNVDGSIEIICSLESLESLHFGGIELTNQVLEKLLSGNGSNLEELTFEATHFSSDSLETLGRFTNLKGLGIADCTGIDGVSECYMPQVKISIQKHVVRNGRPDPDSWQKDISLRGLLRHMLQAELAARFAEDVLECTK